MRILKASAINFGSYKTLDFDFTNTGLVLISGPTGSGKSTLCDIIPWGLFGKTAKGGLTGDVLAWNASTDTQVTLKLVVFQTPVVVVRTRGVKSSDLYFCVNDEVKIRGKDLADTQRQLDRILGMDINVYLTGSYFNEFSPVGQFFTANAKSRRQIMEQLVDLTLASTIAETSSAYKKTVKAELEAKRNTYDMAQNSKEMLEKQHSSTSALSAQWDKKTSLKAEDLLRKADAFEYEKQSKLQILEKEQETGKHSILFEISELSNSTNINDLETRLATLTETLDQASEHRCETCGAEKEATLKFQTVGEINEIRTMLAQHNRNAVKVVDLQQKLEKLEKSAVRKIQEEKDRKNDYLAIRNELLESENPHQSQIVDLVQKLLALSLKNVALKIEINLLQHELDDVALLEEVNASFRAAIVENTVLRLEQDTNSLLETHFDSELRVKFEGNETDKIEVLMKKDGNDCNFTQLSKGQRQLLKLCFAISVMDQTQNHNTISFNALFFDEAFEGLSEELKIKCYGLLKGLEQKYESVFVVEHSQELKMMFDNRFEVALNNGCSIITRAVA